MTRKASRAQIKRAQSYGLRVTKKVGGKRVYKTAAELKKAVDKKLKSKKQVTTGLGGSYSKKADYRIKGASKAGKRTSKKTSTLVYLSKDGTRKKVTRRNANQFVGKKGTGTTAGGRKYSERRVNRTDAKGRRT